MKFVTSPALYDEHTYMTLFLAGSIEQGKAKPWHGEVAAALEGFSDGLQVLNPRREQWDATLVQDISNETFAEQVRWELDGIDQSSVVFFYFQGNTLSPITLMELGYVAKDDPKKYRQIVVVCEPDFWRRGNIQVLVDRIPDGRVYLFDDLQSGIDHLVRVTAGNMQYENW